MSPDNLMDPSVRARAWMEDGARIDEACGELTCTPRYRAALVDLMAGEAVPLVDLIAAELEAEARTEIEQEIEIARNERLWDHDS